MCGITGAIDKSAERAALRVLQLNEGQRHRGPDHAVVARASIFTLGNTRLAIQDPGPAGNQPFKSSDGRYHCVFNGEIYNYRELIRRYGLSVRSNCDGEIIPALWSKMGEAALAEFRGMFAIALADSLEEKLYLARDPFGIKPLYWRHVSDGLLFASEVRSLLDVEDVAGTAQMNLGAIARYLHLGAMAADQTPFRDIAALQPNTVACFGPDCRPATRQIQSNGPFTAPRASGPLGQALEESVELHLAANVPSTLLLSSGVDSATIAAIGHRLGQQLNCLTVAAEGSADESHLAAQTARHYGHRFQRVPAVLTASDVTRFFNAMQRPTIDGLNTFTVCQAVHAAGYKVALSGLGGDEAVGGYSHFRLLPFLPALRALDRLPARMADLAGVVLSRLGLANDAKTRRLVAVGGPRDGWTLSSLQREVLPTSVISGLTGTSGEYPGDACPSWVMPHHQQLTRMTAAEVVLYLQATLLPDADTFSMSSSVELRVPFVDGGVFSAALRLAAGQRIGKKAIGGELNDPFLEGLADRVKRGFSVPMRQWMAGPLQPTVSAAADPRGARVVAARSRRSRPGRRCLFCR